jgi:hypothetical protein
MKKTIIVFLTLLFTVSGIIAQHEPLQLTLVPEKGKFDLRDTKHFEFCIKNVTNQNINVIVPHQTEPYWGGYKTLWFISLDGKVNPPVTNPPLPSAERPKNKGIVSLKPGDSIMVNSGYLETPQLRVYKVWGVFVQNRGIPEKIGE